jgi:hypothetical protein
MRRERWGTFSVIDHKDPAGLIPEVLLYDRLMIPVPPTADDRQRWEQRGWEPDLLFARLEKLGPLAYHVNWGYDDARSAIHEWAEKFAQVKDDVVDIVRETREKLGYQLTRRVLAQQRPLALPSGVEDVDLVAAYQSEADLRVDFTITNADDEKADLGFRLGQKIAIPVVGRNAEKTLESVIDVARDSDLRHRRGRVYELQNLVLAQKRPTLDMLLALEKAGEDFVDFIKLALTNVRFTFAFTLAAMPPGSMIGIPLSGFASPSTPLSSIVLRPRVPFLAATAGTPAAMYHEG